MAVKYIPYFPDTIEGQAILDNFVRTRRMLKYRDNDKTAERIRRGMPCYEMETIETHGENSQNLIIRGECLSACAYLKEQGKTVDLVYIDPPFASGADYAKKVYIRRNPHLAEKIAKAEEELDIEELRAFEEKMYGDVWDKEKYLNWMYENLMAIKSVMSETASIYVHLDWHIGHYVKILMDEIFGEDNFVNEIVWYFSDNFQGNVKGFATNHNVIFWYRKSDEYIADKVMIPLKNTVKRDKRIWSKELSKLISARDEDGKLIYEEYNEKKADDVWEIGQSSVTKEHSGEFIDYATQKPEEILRRVITASSNEGMTVADFFGGSGVTAAVANKLGRNFIHCDVGINSIQTTRDRLVANKAAFKILEIKDGVSLYRNPVQTMDKLKSLIPGLRNEDVLDKFWEGSIHSAKDGMMPVYIPNLMDSSTKLLDIVLMNRILREALPDLPDNTKKVIVYYIDISDKPEIEKFIKDQNDTLIEIELRDLKEILDDVVVNDYAEYNISEYKPDILTNGNKVEVTKFISDRVQRKIDEYNQKGQANILKGTTNNDESDNGTEDATPKKKVFVPVSISDNGLELIEFISLDCTSDNGIWHSDSEIKITKDGFVIRNGVKTKEFWNGTITCDSKPLRLKIRNICGDETVFSISL